MNKYTLTVTYSNKDVAKSAGAIWQAYNKKWVFFGDTLPAALEAFPVERTDERIESTCNTCHCEFNETDVLRQSASNRGWLATKVRGQVVQECCEACAQDCES